LLAAVAAEAQVSVSLKVEHEQYLAGESIQVRVRVENVSGQTLDLGNTDDWLTFFVESGEGRSVQKIAEVPVRGPFDVKTSEAATKQLNIAPYFSISEIGHYKITAALKVDQWGGTTWTTDPVSFMIIGGSQVVSLPFGHPRPSAPPEMMAYSLLKVHRDNELKLYFRLVEQATGAITKTYGIGGLASFSTIDARLDRLNRMHLLYQNGARGFTHCVFDTSGEWIYRQSYEISSNRPSLYSTDTGDITVLGGLRRLSREDFSKVAPQPGAEQVVPTPPDPAQATQTPATP